jgi:hypothetical protein
VYVGLRFTSLLAYSGPAPCRSLKRFSQVTERPPHDMTSGQRPTRLLMEGCGPGHSPANKQALRASMLRSLTV